MKRILCIIILIITITILYGVYFNTKGLKINEYIIEDKNIPKSYNELKFIQFSDILYKSTYTIEDINNLVDEINDINPDIVFFTGDLFNKEYKPTEEDISNLTKSFSKINSNLYKYAIIGDNDKKYIDSYKQVLNDSNFILLDEQSKLLFYKDINPINIIGLNDTSKIDELLNTEFDSSYNIVLTHNPDNFDTISNKNVNLVLSGHSLNGQIRIPFYGGLLKRNGCMEYIDKYYEKNNTKMYVSNGLGTIKYKIRLFNKPSINLIRFSK